MRTSDEFRAAFDVIQVTGWHQWPTGPYAFTVAGQEWAIATDGTVLVAVHRELVSGDFVDAPDSVKKLMNRWVEHAATTPSVVESAKFKAFARVGDPIPHCDTCDGRHEIACDECDGAGSCECECSCGDVHDRDCRRCKGEGTHRYPDCSEGDNQRPARLMSGTVNRRKLALVLQTVADDDTPIAVSMERYAPDEGALTVYLLRPATDNPWWMALVMGMRNVTPRVSFDDPATWQLTSGVA